MDIKELILRGFKVVWNKPHDVQFIDENDKFALLHYHFMEGEISSVLITSKKSKWCGIKMTRSDLVFPYYQIRLEVLQKLFQDEVISMTV